MPPYHNHQNQERFRFARVHKPGMGAASGATTGKDAAPVKRTDSGDRTALIGGSDPRSNPTTWHDRTGKMPIISKSHRNEEQNRQFCLRGSRINVWIK
ncbi:hypothetical protein K227x_16450 [Rubripirellula lacrimiformis]|uniref:Uncharacterized protein n=1 Tax=Rubripirellula lacrimiformis TaxID=1930273 RepID=A0A517N7Z8_9BACT|nr:hypothetical protein K227x_16450 [Rubripirellula lacrimiformis]